MAGAGILAVLVCLLAGCFSGSTGQGDVVDAAADGILAVGIVDGDDSFAREGEDGFAGAEPDILKGLAGELDVQVEYIKAEDARELMALLGDGKVDIAAGRLTGLESFENSFLKSRNYAKTGIYLITKKNRYVDTLAGYEDGIVGVSWQIPGYEVLDIPYITDLEREVYDDILKLPQDIEKGAILAGICTEREALEILRESDGVQAMEMRGGPRLESFFYLAPGQDALAGSLNRAINTYLDQKAQEE